LAEYELFKRDLFANWQNNWSIFYSYFYRGAKKETVLSYLDQIAGELLKRLDLKDYTFHKVDFQGPSNFGSSYCWIALYPITKESHKESYQFFVKLSATPESGKVAGHSLKSANSNQLKKLRYIRANTNIT
jgi:5-methylcytosine-specific restriction protein B